MSTTHTFAQTQEQDLLAANVAGSDLASLKTAAVRDADYYIVNGAKLWTTEAHWADWMHCLVRTASDGKPQKGITCLLIDMQTAGITLAPIVTIDGIHHTNQVFLYSRCWSIFGGTSEIQRNIIARQMLTS